MSIQIAAIRLSGGSGHEHIVRLWWTNPSDGQSDNSSRAETVSFIEDSNGKAYVEDAYRHRVDVGVVRPAYGEKYLRTHADGRWTNNLLSLPQR